jgi:hypothetical protein
LGEFISKWNKIPNRKFVPYRKNKLFWGGRTGIKSTHFCDNIAERNKQEMLDIVILQAEYEINYFCENNVFFTLEKNILVI